MEAADGFLPRQQSLAPDSTGDHWDSVSLQVPREARAHQAADHAAGGGEDTHTPFIARPGSSGLLYRGVKTFFWTRQRVAVAISAPPPTKENPSATSDADRCTTCPLRVEATMLAEQGAPWREDGGATTARGPDVVLCHLVPGSREALLANQQLVATTVSAVLSRLQLTQGVHQGVYGVTLDATHAERLDAYHARRSRRPDSQPGNGAEQGAMVRTRSASFDGGDRHEAAGSIGAQTAKASPDSMSFARRPAGNPHAMSGGHPKVVTAEDAVAEISSGQTVAISGFVGSGHPEELVLALAARFQRTGAPGSLSLVFGVAQGDTAGRGLDVLAQDGLISRVVSAHNGVAPGLQRFILEEKCEAFNIPLGCLSQLLRDVAAGKPGMLTRVGLGTVVDPRHGGCALNERARSSSSPVVTLESLGGEELLWFKSFRIDVAILRGTTADARGNISMEEEVGPLDMLHQAIAAHCSGGLVLVQVRRLSDTLLPGRAVTIPGILVDRIVVADPAHHWQTFAGPISEPSLCGQRRAPLEKLAPLPLDAVKVMCRRAAMELSAGTLVNLGLGIPERVAMVLNEHRQIANVTLTAEAGVIGGVPSNKLRFGAAYNPDVMLPTAALFDLYDGGGLDLSCLGMAECDELGNVNVGQFSSRVPGLGGFTNISQNAKKIVFMGFLTCSGLKVEVGGGKLRIVQEGEVPKFVQKVQQVSFSAEYCDCTARDVIYVTERAVFRLAPDGLVLEEVAPGVDTETDVLAQMQFRPRISPTLREMDKALFTKDAFALTI